MLTLHGDKDTCVPYEVSQLYGTPNPRSQFVTVLDSEHGFGRSQESGNRDSEDRPVVFR